MLLLRKGWHQSYFIKTSHISNSLIRILIDYDATRQKYLHTVNFPSLSIALNSPDDSFFLTCFMMRLPPVIALSQLGHKQIPTTRMYFILKNELLHHVRQTR